MDKQINQPQRLQSLDALRGFAMFWIIGGDMLVHSLAEATGWSALKTLSIQLDHVPWNGFHFYDLIFPLFMFVSGVAMPFSLDRRLEKGESKSRLLGQVAKRALLLVLLGIIYNNGFSFDFAHLRYASVLGQIGGAYFLATLLYLHASVRWQMTWLVAILLAYWAAMVLVPVPGFGAGVLTPEGSFSGYVDRLFLPGKMYKPDYDPEGILHVFSAMTITLAGTMVGRFMKNSPYDGTRKTINMAIVGVLVVVLSVAWNHWYPINKEIWSSSFSLLTIGLAMLLMAVFYFVIDVVGLSKWAFPFVVIGLNSITMYMATRFIDFFYTSDFILSGIRNISGAYSTVVLHLGVIVLEWLFLYFLYRKRIFLKV